ncbi:hypothetical protein BU17DRAFT_60259 [Hysterangium stoloniferum]|nr:hypothetical protein BU17DRAFT_60259 [Hysterangium stoloniferum]
MGSSSQTIDIQTLSLDLRNYRAVAYSDVVSVTVLLYDYFLTIGAEIDFIWPIPWSLGKVLFYATKYPALLDSTFLLYTTVAPPGTTPSTCELLYKLAGGMIVAGITVAEFVLVFRTWAIWGKNSVVGISLLCAAFILSEEAGPLSLLHYIETVGFFAYFVRSQLMLLAGKGILFYLCLTGISVINMIILVIKPTPAKTSLSPSLSPASHCYNSAQRVFHSILTARILVNIRKAARTNCTNYDTVTNTDNTHRNRTILSSVIGVDTWFQNPELPTQMALPDEESALPQSQPNHERI